MLPARVEQREGMFWGLNKTRCPSLLSFCTHALGRLLSLLELLLNTTDGTKNQVDSVLSLSEVHHLLYQLPLLWSGFQLSVCLFPNLLIFLSAPPLPPCPHAWQNFSSSPSTPQSLLTLVTDTHTHTLETPTWDYSTLSPVHPLQVALPVPCINSP